MTQDELDQYIPPRMLQAGGDTLAAVYLHFLQGRTIQEAADECLISRQSLNQAVVKIMPGLLAAGYVRQYVRRVIYTRPAKAVRNRKSSAPPRKQAAR